MQKSEENKRDEERHLKAAGNEDVIKQDRGSGSQRAMSKITSR